MTQIKTEYKGYSIYYSDNRDMWCCGAFDLEAMSLSSLRTKIDLHDRNERRIEPVQVYVIPSEYSGGPASQLVDVTLIKPADKQGKRGVRIRREGFQAVNTYRTDPTTKKTIYQQEPHVYRENASMEYLAPATPEAKTAIEAYNAAWEVEHAAAARRKELHALIPRVTLDHLKGVKSATEVEEPSA